MIIREIDKFTEEYYTFGKEFRKLFDSHYFIQQYEENPFRYKDNRYYFGYVDGEFIGAINYIFLKKDAFHALYTGKMHDDMNLKCKDIAPLKAHDINHVYISAIYITKANQSKGYFDILLDMSLNEIKSITNNNLELLACCINDKSKNLFVKHDFNVKLVNKSEDTVVYKNLLK